MQNKSVNHKELKRYLFFGLIVFCFFGCTESQLKNDDDGKTVSDQDEVCKNEVCDTIRIPDIEGYLTLKCDFHIHTVFSDGLVWPDIRVDEAWQQGYDAIAITDHIEFRPFIDEVKGDHNESYKIAKRRADQLGLIVIKGSEITRNKPFGHFNALFLTDSNLLEVRDSLEAIDIARRQGAVIQWNHPGRPDTKSIIYAVHEKMMAENKIDMVEVFNRSEYYPLTFDWIDQYDLAPVANSDIHDSIRIQYGVEKMSRPITLVFARDRTEFAIKEAIIARRTAALFNNTIVAKNEWAEKLFWACVQRRNTPINQNTARIELKNISDIPFVMHYSANVSVLLPASGTVTVTCTLPGTLTIDNIFTGYKKNLEIRIPTE